jgi:hypothetical protein
MPTGKTGDPDAFGYEVQIADAPGLHPTGSILHHLDSKANNVHKPNEWNHMTIVCQGEHIVITLNGLVAVDTKERGSKKGRIGFQVPKGDAFAKQEVRFRNIRVTPMAAEAATKGAAG